MSQRRPTNTANKSSEYSLWKHDALIAATCGGVAAAVIGLALFVAGNVSGGEARKLLEAIMPCTRFSCSSEITATAKIMALMLTLLNLSLNADPNLDNAVYYRLCQIAFYDMLMLIVATCFLVVHCVPVRQSDEAPYCWYPTD